MSGDCGLCGGGGARPLFVKDGAPYFECRACGFRYSRPASDPNRPELLSDYEDAYLQYLEDHHADHANHQMLLDWIRRSSDLSRGELLDVGCGSGKFVRFLRTKDIPAFGVESSAPIFERYLAGQPHFTRGTAADAIGRRFTAVTLLDVIEHVTSPLETLTSARELLAPGGRIYLSTPDANSLSARVCGRNWHFYNKYHLSLFSPRTLASAAAGVGLRVASIEHFGKRFPLGYLLRYGRDFVLGRRVHGSREPSLLDDIQVPINLRDVLYACLERS